MTRPGATVLALDLGSSSVRAVVCDDHARPVDGALARREVTPHQGEDGRAELDPEEYVTGLIDCLDELAGSGLLDGVTAVGTSSQWHSILAVDAANRPRSGVLTWLDTRARPQAEPEDPRDFHARTGGWPHTLYWTAKAPFLAEQLGLVRESGPVREPGACRFLGLPDYVRARLLDAPATSLSMASGTGMLDLVAGQWDPEALALAGIDADQVPPIEDDPAYLGAEFARRWPALADVPWHPVLGDGAASNLGSGCGAGERAAVTVGTSAALRVVHESSDAPAPAWPVWRYRVDSERLVSGIAFSGGGVLHAWTTQLLRMAEDTEPTGIAPGSHGLVCLPMHAGSRPPETIRPGSGALTGLSLGTTREEIVAATMEGVTLEIARALEEVEASFGRRFDVVMGGGGTASTWWQHAFAAILDRPVRVATDPEVGARGAAAHALGLELPAPTEIRSPRADDAKRMRAVRPEYERVRAALLT